MAVKENSKRCNAWCNECSIALGPDNPLNEHYRSRSHLNRLLQLGVEIPVDEELEKAEEVMTVSQKIAYCVICEISIGTPVQAAAHYRCRDHLNRRLQRGLPVAELHHDADDRDRFNQCLRQGVPVQPLGVGIRNGAASSFSTMKSLNGKRKLPPSSVSPASGIVKSSQSPMGMPIPSFVNEKRSRSQGSLSKSFSPKCFAGSTSHSLSQSRHTTYLPSSSVYGGQTSGSAYWSPAPSDPYEVTPPFPSGTSYRTPQTTHGSSDFASQPVTASFYGSRTPVASSHWASLLAADRNVAYTDGWYCDLCNVPLHNIVALNMHTLSTEHKINEMRSTGHLSHWT